MQENLRPGPSPKGEGAQRANEVKQQPCKTT